MEVLGVVEVSVVVEVLEVVEVSVVVEELFRKGDGVNREETSQGWDWKHTS